MTLSDIQFDFPAGVWLLALLPFIAWLYLRLFSWQTKALNEFSASPLNQQILYSPSKPNRWRKAAYLCLAWLCATLAIMQPKGNPRYPIENAAASKEVMDVTHIVKRKAHDVYFLIDTSQSMEVTDTPEGKSRLSYAKELADEIASDLTGETAALYAFTSDVTTIVPSTLDYLYLRLMLSRLTFNEGDVPGTNFLELFDYMNQQIQVQPKTKLKTLVIFSDGGDTLYDVASPKEKDQREQTILDAVGAFEKSNVRIFTIGIGSLQGEKVPNVSYKGNTVTSALNPHLLKKISQAGQGYYWDANEATVTTIASEVISGLNEQKSDETRLTNQRLASAQSQDLIYDYYFQVPLFFALLFFVTALSIPEARKEGSVYA